MSVEVSASPAAPHTLAEGGVVSSLSSKAAVAAPGVVSLPTEEDKAVEPTTTTSTTTTGTTPHEEESVAAPVEKASASAAVVPTTTEAAAATTAAATTPVVAATTPSSSATKENLFSGLLKKKPKVEKKGIDTTNTTTTSPSKEDIKPFQAVVGGGEGNVVEEEKLEPTKRPRSPFADLKNKLFARTSSSDKVAATKTAEETPAVEKEAPAVTTTEPTVTTPAAPVVAEEAAEPAVVVATEPTLAATVAAEEEVPTATEDTTVTAAPVAAAAETTTPIAATATVAEGDKKVTVLDKVKALFDNKTTKKEKKVTTPTEESVEPAVASEPEAAILAPKIESPAVEKSTVAKEAEVIAPAGVTTATAVEADTPTTHSAAETEVTKPAEEKTKKASGDLVKLGRRLSTRIGAALSPKKEKRDPIISSSTVGTSEAPVINTKVDESGIEGVVVEPEAAKAASTATTAITPETLSHEVVAKEAAGTTVPSVSEGIPKVVEEPTVTELDAVKETTTTVGA